MSQNESPFRLSANGYFMEIAGPASYKNKPWYEGRGAARRSYASSPRTSRSWPMSFVELAERPDCYYVKYSTYQKDGMYLGRCFLMDEHEVGLLWAKYKEHPRLFCSIQDDDFTAPFRPS